MERQFSRIQTIDYLIRIKGTGSCKQLANGLHISERTVQEAIKFMKEHLGCPIAYDRYKETYYYLDHGGVSLRFQKTKGI